MFLLIKTNARILDLRPVSDFPPCSSGRIPMKAASFNENFFEQ